MNQLFLSDLAKMSDKEIRSHLVSSWQVDRKEVDKYNILIAYESVGSWGCDSSAWFLLEHKKTRKLFEVHGSHCSCHGFETQFQPEKTSVKYLTSDKFRLYCGGYENDCDGCCEAIKQYLKTLKEV